MAGDDDAKGFSAAITGIAGSKHRRHARVLRMGRLPRAAHRRAILRFVLGGFLGFALGRNACHAMQRSVLDSIPAPDDSAGVAGQLDSAAGEDPESLQQLATTDNFVLRSPTVIDHIRATASQPTAGWVLASGSASLAIDAGEWRANTGATACLAISGLSASISIRKNLGSRGIVPRDGVLVIPVKISEIPLLDPDAVPVVARPFGIVVELCSDNDFDEHSARLAKSFTMTSFQFLRSGWNDLQISAADNGTLNTTGLPGWTYGGTAPGTSRSEYRYMRILIQGLQATATQAPVVKLGGIYQNGLCSANVLLSCDDAHQDTIDIVRVFNDYGIPVSVGVITGAVGTGAQMSAARIRAISDAGNDCTSHSSTHPAGQGLQGVGAGQLEDEVTESLAWLRSNGLSRAASVFIYPENAFGDREIAAVRAAGYVVARGSKPGWIVTVFGIDNPYALGSRDVGGNTLAKVYKYLDSAQAYGCTQAIFTHRIAFVPITSLTVSAGIGTVVHPPLPAPVPPGTTVCLRGFDNPEHNVEKSVRAGSTTTGFTIRLWTTDGAATSAENNKRFFSPTYPTAGGSPPASTLYWYLSDYIALAKELDRRRAAGSLRPIGYVTLLSRCSLG